MMNGPELNLQKEGNEIYQRSLRYISLYQLKKNEDWKDITEEVLQSSDTAPSVKQAIQNYKRRIIIFSYPSDNLQIKGFISVVENPQHSPLIIFLRGGNRLFGLPYPANDLTCHLNFTTIATTYRGGVSEGRDEYGGNDVADVRNLMDFLDRLEKKIPISFSQNPLYFMGLSRGSMEMFLALARYPEIQKRIQKVVSLSGLLDMPFTLKNRPDLREVFCHDFGLIPSQNEESWCQARDPVVTVPFLRKNMPILIIQGTADIRTPPGESIRFLKELEKQGNRFTYLEIPGATHCLVNRPDRMNLIVNWLKKTKET